MKIRTDSRGFSLIELLVFIVIVGILATGFGMTFFNLLRGAGKPNRLTVATLLAQERMEFILAQRRLHGFESIPAGFSNYPCDQSASIPICTLPSGLDGYSVGASVEDLFQLPNVPPVAGVSRTNYKRIVVQVTGPGDMGHATLESTVAKY